MKIDAHPEAGPVRSASTQGRFPQELKKATPRTGAVPPRSGPPLPSASARSHPTSAVLPGVARVASSSRLASAEHLGQVRQGLHAEAHRLLDVRGEAQRTQREQVHHRVGELIARELAREPPTRTPPRPSPPDTTLPPSGAPVSPEPSGAVPGPQGTASPAPIIAPGPQAPAPEARVQATLALIEKLELFVKSQRPALALQLGGDWNARVEVERTGVGEVALRIQGQRGPLASQDLTRLREALVARGLKLSAFSAC